MSLRLCLHCSFLILAWRLFCGTNDKSLVEFTEQHLECIHQLKDGEIPRTTLFHVHKSPIRTVIVSQGDASDFHHIQGVVGDLIAIRIQNVGVYLSPPP